MTQQARKDLEDLGEEFWTWRAATAPDSYDDLPRVQRPHGWVPDWSADAIAARRRTLREFTGRQQALDLSDAPTAVQVDGRLLRSALDRVHWELDLLRSWQRNPCFYIDQALVPIYNLLLAPPPFDQHRAAAIVGCLERVPDILRQGCDNLAGHAVAPFAQYALRQLGTATDALRESMTALAPLLPEPQADALRLALDAAANAVEGFSDWLTDHLPVFTSAIAAGPDTLAFLLHRIALLPYSATDLRAMARQEWRGAVSEENALRQRHRDPAPPTLPRDTAELIERQQAAESATRRFYTEHGLLSQPDDLRHYRYAPMPPYIAPLTWLGVEHDATSPTRDAVRYVADPHPGLPYFQLAAARDPRTTIAHEGVHAQQLALSWRHPDPLRRHFYDSVPNEGIAFYNEVLMLQIGYFDDSPHTELFVVNAMRLKALRVEIDLSLALGDLTLDQAAARLATAVPMDEETAWLEAVYFASHPGLGLGYLTGNLQILDLLVACMERDGGAFDLQRFHDRLWREGNVPLTLQRWELLDLRDHLDKADRLSASQI
ncbi:DUF885 family protein [Actinomadura sp. 6N118]|uniref:DUF885 family protein n=1 Tax=Actinomadura sp. 6N118 TaxID=3375151 RepID=UPI0037B1B197